MTRQRVVCAEVLDLVSGGSRSCPGHSLLRSSLRVRWDWLQGEEGAQEASLLSLEERGDWTNCFLSIPF